MSLYNKYRPKTFDEIVSNQETVEVLKNLLSSPNPPHSYLLHGPTGCGKTTLGRIIAFSLNSSGENLIEINSADFRGIDTIREIYQRSMYSSLRGQNKVFIIDECHKLTNDAQNALLKMLEEPPISVYFVLCTTDPQKLLETVRGRCQQLAVSPLNELQTKRLLRGILVKEGKRIKEEVMLQIIETSRGLPRNAIQILEQVLSVAEDKQLEVAKKFEERKVASIELCRALIGKKSWKEISSILKELKNDEDPETLRRMILGYFQTVLLSKEDDRVAAIMEPFLDSFYNSGFPGLVYACYLASHLD